MNNIKIDPKIKPLITQLNLSGLHTRYSCQGHGKQDEGYVMFKRLLTPEEIEQAKEIFHQHGILRVRNKPQDSHWGKVTNLRFSSRE